MMCVYLLIVDIQDNRLWVENRMLPWFPNPCQNLLLITSFQGNPYQTSCFTMGNFYFNLLQMRKQEEIQTWFSLLQKLLPYGIVIFFKRRVLNSVQADAEIASLCLGIQVYIESWRTKACQVHHFCGHVPQTKLSLILDSHHYLVILANTSMLLRIFL